MTTNLDLTMERPAHEPDACDDARTASASAAWIARAVCGPAHVQMGTHRLTTPQRLWLDPMLRCLQHALKDVLQRTVAIRLGEPGTASPDQPSSFIVVIRAGDGRRRYLVLDDTLARACVDAVMFDRAGVRGYGGLTGTESGLLEFVILATLDAMITRLPILNGIVVEQFIESTAPRPPDCVLTDGLAVNCAITGRLGTLTLAGPGWDSRDLPLPTECAPDAVDEAGDPLRVGVALPTIDLSADEWRAARIGDLLFLDAPNLASLTATSQIVTQSGWQLARAELDVEKPGFLQFSCGPLTPRVPESLASEADTVFLRPVIGWTELPAERLTRWDANRTLVVRLDRDSPVSLFRDQNKIAMGEFVRIEDELAIRILDLRRDADDSTASSEAGS